MSLKKLRKKNIPYVFFDRQLEELGFRSVIFNDKIGAINALDQIVKKGYSRIAHFAGYSNVSIARNDAKDIETF